MCALQHDPACAVKQRGMPNCSCVAYIHPVVSGKWFVVKPTAIKGTRHHSNEISSCGESLLLGRASSMVMNLPSITFMPPP